VTGDFQASSGGDRHVHVLMHDPVPAHAHIGQTIPARDTGDRSGVFAATGSTEWQTVVAAIAMGGAYLFRCMALWLVPASDGARAEDARPGTRGPDSVYAAAPGLISAGNDDNARRRR